MSLTDNCGRPLLNLRISITQRCNYHCAYCHSEGEVEQANVSERKNDSGRKLCASPKPLWNWASQGLNLQAANPSCASDICQIVKGISAIPGLKDLSLTTNGLLLADTAKNLRESGLNRINISLASLNPETYSKLTGGNLENALAGVDAASESRI